MLGVELWNHQKDFINLIEKNDRLMVAKSRQLGISTTLILWALDKILTKKDYRIVFITVNENEKFHAYEKTKEIISKSNLTDKFTHIQTERIMTEKGSLLSFVVANKCVLRGAVANAIIMDELAFSEHGESTLVTALPSMPEKIIFASTPNGINKTGKFFYEEFKNTISGKSDFKFHKIMWFNNTNVNPSGEYIDWQLNEWAIGQAKIFPAESFRQEILCEFIGFKEPVERKKQMFNFRIEKHLMDRFKTIAEIKGRNYSEILRNLISEYINK